MSKGRKRSHHRSFPHEPGLKEIFGAVVSHPDRFGGRPFLREKNVEVQPILDLIMDGLTDRQICNRLKKEKIATHDVEAVRAYQARFLPETLSKEFNRAASTKNMMLLDENIPYRTLYDVVRLFGRSSHARADGLYDEHNDDEHDIWQHAIDNKYAAVVTADADFLRISQFHRNRMEAKYGSLKACPEHIPALIYFERPVSKNETVRLLEQNRSAIMKFLRSNDAVALKITEDGCEKIYKHTHGKGMKNGDDGLDHSGPSSAPAP
ncbi:MAG TPA: DUF5615 family PIN-like protein [Patescibacteria group bacterium]|nr:DUF5615 family PIN-like protein [Patescibacteria group bacterium]